MSSEQHIDFTVLSQLVDGLLSADERAQIEERLMSDPEFRRRYVQFMDMDFELSQRLCREIPTPVGNTEPILIQAAQSNAGSALIFFKIAAILVLGLGIWSIALLFQSDPEDTQLFSQPTNQTLPKRKPASTPQSTPVVNEQVLADTSKAVAMVSEAPVSSATKESKPAPDNFENSPPQKPAKAVVQPVVVGSFWASGSPGSREAITTGEHSVNEDTVEFRLDTGVRVKVEGPAQFAIESGMKMRLISGRISAEVFPTAIGFQVEANAVSVTDFGTRFAVTANADGDAAVHVYDGIVTASTGTEPVPLKSDDTRRLNLKTGLLDPIRFDEKLFAAKPSWSGDIEWYSEDVEILPEPPRDANQIELPVSHPVIFRERSGILLRRAVTVNLLPDHVASSTDEGELEIPKGHTVSSYCLHGSTPAPERISGQVRFDSPVLGIIFDSVLLDETDRTLGARRTDYPAGISYRGIEPGDLQNKKTIIVEPDGRTVTFSFSAPNFDQFRILVAED